VDAALAAAGIAGDRRPQTLSVAEWIGLLGALGPLPPDHRGRRGARAEIPEDDEPAPAAADDGEAAGEADAPDPGGVGGPGLDPGGVGGPGPDDGRG
jgi:hypothetical protein